MLSSDAQLPNYVVLLRGINVGRAKRVAMADLRAVVTAGGANEASTVLQSGNVVCSAAAPPDAWALRAALAARTGVDAAVLVLPASAYLAVLAANPLRELAADPARLLISFLPGLPPADLVLPDPDALAPEVLAVGSRAIYQWCPDGVVASRVPSSFWRQLDPRVTSRNLRTAERIAALLAG